MKIILLLSFLLSVFILVLSCTKEGVNDPVGNQPPETGLFLYPDSTIRQQPSRLNVHWWGDDPDGLISGFYFMWEGIDSSWSFTTANDSIFALPIGSSDTSYKFIAAAVDASGNGVYDNSVVQNGIDFGPEPFIDENEDSVYNDGEFFNDIGLIDPTPASLIFPIKNTPPVVAWNDLTVLPDTSFPVMTFKWDADDLDGRESIKFINIALNDTNNFISLNGSISLVTIRIKDLDNPVPEMEILINGSDQNIFEEVLQGVRLNDNNIFYVQAEDLSGAKSQMISLPDSSDTWYVKKPKGQVLILDDFQGGSSDEQATIFYNQVFSEIDSGSLAGKFDVYDLFNQPLPFESVTLFETIKLFDYTFWYSASNPRLDLLNIVTNRYLQSGGKIAFSMTFQNSGDDFTFDLSILQGFLPIDDVSDFIRNLFSPADIVASSSGIDYPSLKTTVTIGFVRTYVPNTLVTTEIYDLVSSQMNGNVGFINNNKTEFFIGLPLHDCNGGDQNVADLLEKVFFEEFGLIP
ncbi:hypothetical protein ACFLSH_03355 [Bacteroidota bacterium]